ncbi:zinc finger, CCHC-type containing protein [Tanacetum coccineum]
MVTGTPLNSPKGTMWFLFDPTPSGSISTWEDLTTRFFVQFFPPGRIVKLCNDILMFQQHQGESLSDAWTRFKDILQNVPHYGIDRWLQIQFFYDHEIIENLALYDHEGMNDSKDSIKSVKAISNPEGTSKTSDRRLLELEDQINFLQKGSFTFRERVCPNPQPQALETSFKARVRDYMAAHTERMERFENAIFKQQEEINKRMTEMFGLLKELTSSRDPKKLLIREVAKHPITKNVNSISFIRGEEEMNFHDNASSSNSIKRPDGSDMEVQLNEVEKKNEAENGTKNEPIKSAKKEPTQVEEEESAEAPSSQPVGYYLKHRINEKLIKGLVENHMFNDSLLVARVGKMKWKTYNLLPRRPVYEAILKKR